MDADSRKIPSHEVTYSRLRDMILYGHLAPGAQVTIQGLIADLGAGMTPVREAIRRLTAEGALLPQGNRRVAVPQLSAEMLDQVAFARLAIEPKICASWRYSAILKIYRKGLKNLGLSGISLIISKIAGRNFSSATT